MVWLRLHVARFYISYTQDQKDGRTILICIIICIRECSSTLYVGLAHAAPPTQYNAFTAFSAIYIYTLRLLLIAGTNFSEFSGNQQNR